MAGNSQDSEFSNFWLFSLIFSNSSKDKESIVFMTEYTEKKDLLIYMYQNRYKYYGSKFINAIPYIIRRLCIFPILYPALYSSNFVVLAAGLLIIFRSMKPKKKFTTNVRSTIFAASFYIALLTVQQFIANIFPKFYLSSFLLEKIGVKSTSKKPSYLPYLDPLSTH